MSGAELIALERQRQIEKENWTPSHDDGHDMGELAIAAAVYATFDTDASVNYALDCEDADIPSGWPWGRNWWKPKDEISNLVRAGALIAAEIDRLQRQVVKEQSSIPPMVLAN